MFRHRRQAVVSFAYSCGSYSLSAQLAIIVSADSVDMWLEFQEFEDTSTIQILQSHVQLGRPISSYAKAKSVNPIDIQVASNVVDGRNIKLSLCATAPNALDTLRHKFKLAVTNGVKLHGMLQGNHTLYPDVQYIVTQNLAMPEGDTLFIKPGTTLKMKDGISINATIIAIGKPDSMITFTKADLSNGWISIISNHGMFNYCIFEYMLSSGTNRPTLSKIYRIDNSIIRI